MHDLKVTLETTQIIRHAPMVVEEVNIGDGKLDLQKVLDILIKWNWMKLSN